MATVTALSTIIHDGTEYSEGDTIEVTSDQAASLINTGVAKKGRVAQEAEIVEDKPAKK